MHSMAHVVRLFLSYLQGHLNEHQEFLDADPDTLPFELMGNAGSLFICEASQQLQSQQ